MTNLRDSQIRPVILAGGLGSRLRPRTDHLPKPLLPIDGRPLLWYVLSSLRGLPLLKPIVTLDYKAELITAFFQRDTVDFRILPKRTMAEAFLEVAQSDPADAFLGMSSDVLLPKAGISEAIALHHQNGGMNTALFVKLAKAGHKKWEFVIADDHLVDIRVRDCHSPFERLLLIVNGKTIHALAEAFTRPIAEETLPQHLQGFQTGWTLLLKYMVAANIPVFARFVDLPVHNINVPDDFDTAEQFVLAYMEQQ